MEIKVKHPAIRELLKILPDMPRLLEERRRLIFEQQERGRRVFEKALTQAGLIGPNAKRKFGVR